MSFFDTFTQVSVLFMVVIIGFVANKAKLMDAEFNRRLSSLVIHVTSPFIVLSSAMGDTLPARNEILPVLIFGSGALLLMMILAVPLTYLLRIKGEEAGLYRFMFAFGNVAFIGFPVVAALFGVEAVFYAGVMTLPFNLLLFTIGFIFVVGGANGMQFRLRMFITPALLATYLAILLVYFQVETPRPVASACNLIGSVTIPASLLIIGSSLADIPVLKMLGTPKLYVMCALKLVAVPALIYGILSLCPVEKKYADVIVVLCGMPVAAYGVMFCSKHGIDPTRMSQGTFLSTLFSLFSVPLLSILL